MTDPSAPDLNARLWASLSWADVRADPHLARLADEAEAQEAVFPAGSCVAARDAATERLVRAFPGLSVAAARHAVALVAVP